MFSSKYSRGSVDVRSMKLSPFLSAMFLTSFAIQDVCLLETSVIVIGILFYLLHLENFKKYFWI
jgi:hypothetical protein